MLKGIQLYIFSSISLFYRNTLSLSLPPRPSLSVPLSRWRPRTCTHSCAHLVIAAAAWRTDSAQHSQQHNFDNITSPVPCLRGSPNGRHDKRCPWFGANFLENVKCVDAFFIVVCNQLLFNDLLVICRAGQWSQPTFLVAYISCLSCSGLQHDLIQLNTITLGSHIILFFFCRRVADKHSWFCVKWRVKSPLLIPGTTRSDSKVKETPHWSSSLMVFLFVRCWGFSFGAVFMRSGPLF